MSGWRQADKFMEENVGDDFPAMNNQTMYGYLPFDELPAPSTPSILLIYYFRKIKKLT